MTEKEMREAKVPWPKTMEELTRYIETLSEESRQYSDDGEGYGKAVYCMSMAATAAFYYMSHVVGASGFQAGCADMDVLRRTRGVKHGFRIQNYDDLLYPQHSDRFLGWEALLKENQEWLAVEARKLLAKAPHVHPDVRAHWKRLALYKGRNR